MHTFTCLLNQENSRLRNQKREPSAKGSSIPAMRRADNTRIWGATWIALAGLMQGAFPITIGFTPRRNRENAWLASGRCARFRCDQQCPTSTADSTGPKGGLVRSKTPEHGSLRIHASRFERRMPPAVCGADEEQLACQRLISSKSRERRRIWVQSLISQASLRRKRVAN